MSRSFFTITCVEHPGDRYAQLPIIVAFSMIEAYRVAYKRAYANPHTKWKIYLCPVR